MANRREEPTHRLPEDERVKVAIFIDPAVENGNYHTIKESLDELCQNIEDPIVLTRARGDVDGKSWASWNWHLLRVYWPEKGKNLEAEVLQDADFLIMYAPVKIKERHRDTISALEIAVAWEMEYRLVTI
jgi:hypothetical protein